MISILVFILQFELFHAIYDLLYVTLDPLIYLYLVTEYFAILFIIMVLNILMRNSLYKMLCISFIMMILSMISNHTVYALSTTAYDCTKYTNERSIISSLDVLPCTSNRTITEPINALIQIVQEKDTSTLNVRTCYIKHTRLLYHCAMFSDIQPVTNGMSIHYIKLSREACDNLHEFNRYQTEYDTIIGDLKPRIMNTKTIHNIGKVDDGKCSGTNININDHYYKDIVSYDTYEIQYQEDYINYDKSSLYIMIENKPHLLSMQYGITRDGSIKYWKYTKQNMCDANDLVILYDGSALSYIYPDGRIIWVVNNTDTAFAVEIDKYSTKCHKRVMLLSNPKIFVYKYEYKNSDKFEGSSSELLSLDITTNLMSRIIYLDRHYSSQMSQLSLHLERSFCELRRKQYNQLLAITETNNDHFIIEVFGQRGYMIELRGDVYYINKCKEVIVEVHHTDKCYQYLPVIYNNISMYRNSQTHILSINSEEIICSPVAPNLYKVNNIWIQTSPSLSIVNDNPIILDPNRNNSWIYEESSSFGKHMLYTNEQLKEYELLLRNKGSDKLILKNFGRALSGDDISTDSMTIENVIKEKHMNKILVTSFNAFYKLATNIGNITSSLLGMYLLYKMSIMLFHIIVNSYTLYRQHGLSYRLLGSFSNALTRFFTASGDYKVSDAKIVKWIKQKRNNRSNTLGDSITENGNNVDISDNNNSQINMNTSNKTLYPKIVNIDGVYTVRQ